MEFVKTYLWEYHILQWQIKNDADSEIYFEIHICILCDNYIIGRYPGAFG